MHRLLIATLRLGIAAAILVGLFGQVVVIPAMAADEIDRFPAYEPLAAPYMTIAILGVACAQVALAAAWMLLTMVRRGALFTPAAFRWVDTVIGASSAATLLALGVSGHLAFGDVPAPDSMTAFGNLVAAVVCVGAGAAFTMFMLVMRGLLGKATDLETEMAEVV
jgi:hypothetical protein